jgi:DNA repair protein RecO (recombination protein O)
MFNRYRTRGVILAKADRGEADQIFSLYTEEFGKLDIFAKGIRKIKSKLRGGAETFYLSEIEFIQGKTYKTLTDAVLLDNFIYLRKDLVGLTVVKRVSEILSDFVGGQEPDKKLWDLLLTVIDKLNHRQLSKKNQEPKIIYYYFLWNFISILGYQPDFYRCHRCREKLAPKNIYFSPKEKSLICHRCYEEEMIVVPLEAIKTVRLLLQGDWQILERLKVEEKYFAFLEKMAKYCLPERRQKFEIN